MSNTWITVLGFGIIFLATTAGAALVFFFKKDVSEKLNTVFLGFAAGIMIAASVWSLLIPSIESSSAWGKWRLVPAVVGFMVGGLFFRLVSCGVMSADAPMLPGLALRGACPSRP